MGNAFINSLIVTIPATVIPITIAAFAAYAFAWIPFRGRGILFTIVVALLVVPLQMSLIPILQLYRGLGLYGTFLGIWLAHTAFGLPLAIFLLYNFIVAAATRPVRVGRHRRRVRTSRRSSGSSCRCRSRRSAPSRSSSSCGSGTTCSWRSSSWAPGPTVASCRPRSINLIGSRGGTWHLLTAGAFVTMIVPLLVFLLLQRALRARDPGRLRQGDLARLMIAFAGTELPRSAVEADRRPRGVAGVTLFRAHNVVDPRPDPHG